MPGYVLQLEVVAQKGHYQCNCGYEEPPPAQCRPFAWRSPAAGAPRSPSPPPSQSTRITDKASAISNEINPASANLAPFTTYQESPTSLRPLWRDNSPILQHPLWAGPVRIRFPHAFAWTLRVSTRLTAAMGSTSPATTQTTTLKPLAGGAASTLSSVSIDEEVPDFLLGFAVR